MRNSGLNETQAGIKRNINNLNYTDDTTLMAKSEEELKSQLMKLKEESEKNGLKLSIHYNWFKWILFNGWVIFHGVYVPQLPYPFLCWWASRLLFTFTFNFHALEKEMATHSSVLAWRIPGSGEPGGLPSMGLHKVGHDWSDLAAVAVAASSLYSQYLFIYLGSFWNNLKQVQDVILW